MEFFLRVDTIGKLAFKKREILSHLPMADDAGRESLAAFRHVLCHSQILRYIAAPSEDIGTPMPADKNLTDLPPLTIPTGILPATLTADPVLSVVFSCIAVFGLELTVGVSWAVPLDIGGDYAGSVSSVMNTFGNIGGAISPTALAYLVGAYGWNQPFLVAAVMCVIGALLFWRIDASKPILAN